MANLLINGNDALIAYGVRMGEDFLDALNAFPTMKDNVENESRHEHGKRILTTNQKVASQTVSLTFTVEGATHDKFRENKQKFIDALREGNITLQVPQDSSDIYHLVYKKGTSYAQNPQRTFCKVVCSFEEPDPTNRV